MKKTFFYVGYCAFVMPMILFFSAHGASSVRSLGGAVQSSVAKANANTPRVSSLPLVNKKNVVTATGAATGVKNNSNVNAESQQRMPFGVHISSTAIPTSTSGDIASAQQRGELIERTGELEERTGKVEDRASVLEDRADDVDGRATVLEERADEIEERADVLENRAGVLEERATKLENRATAMEGRAKTLEDHAEDVDSEISKLQEKDREHDASIKDINTALAGKQKTLQGSKYISIVDSDDGTVSTISATYETGTAEESGLTRLYGTIGEAVDGTMTQVAITNELGKLQSSISDVSGTTDEEIAGLKDTKLDKAGQTKNTIAGVTSDGTIAFVTPTTDGIGNVVSDVNVSDSGVLTLKKDITALTGITSSVSGTGNVVTGVSASGDTVTVTKGTLGISDITDLSDALSRKQSNLPSVTDNAGKVLKVDSEGKLKWETDNDTKYNTMIGAGASAAGAAGLVPAPAEGDNTKFLTGAGAWADLNSSISASDGKYLTGITIENGKITDKTESAPEAYGLPTASTTTKGGVIVDGSTITIANDTISVGTITQGQVDGLTKALEGKQPNLPSVNDNAGKVLKVDSEGKLKWETDNDTTYTSGTGISISGNTISLKADALPNLAPYAKTADVDAKLDNKADKTAVTSEIDAAIGNIDWTGKLSEYATKDDLSSISYDDLSDKPTIPAEQVNSDWNATNGVTRILNKPDLSQYATKTDLNNAVVSGVTADDITTAIAAYDFSDKLLDYMKKDDRVDPAQLASGGSSGQVLKINSSGAMTWGADSNTTYTPGTGISISGNTISLDTNALTIPAAANNATLTIQRNGITVDTWTANASADKTIDIIDNDTKYSEGDNITIDANNKISVSGTLSAARLTGGDGVEGQVLQSNGNGTMSWKVPAAPSSTGPTYSAGANIEINAANKISVSGTLPAERLTGSNGTDGQVLTSDGDGNMSWKTPSASSLAIKLPSTKGGVPVYEIWVDDEY